MIASTDISVLPGLPQAGVPTAPRQVEAAGIRASVLEVRTSTATSDGDIAKDTALGRSGIPKQIYSPPLANAMVRREVRADSTPLEIWEGTVVNVDRGAGVIDVLLDAKIAETPRHTGQIDLEWVSEQDQDLVRPGAVFYLTLFKRTLRGSIQNSQELRFRRRPSWSTAELKRIDEHAAMLLSKMKALPIPE